MRPIDPLHVLRELDATVTVAGPAAGAGASDPRGPRVPARRGGGASHALRDHAAAAAATASRERERRLLDRSLPVGRRTSPERSHADGAAPPT